MTTVIGRTNPLPDYMELLESIMDRKFQNIFSMRNIDVNFTQCINELSLQMKYNTVSIG
jgi:hypothetical protein